MKPVPCNLMRIKNALEKLINYKSCCTRNRVTMETRIFENFLFFMFDHIKSKQEIANPNAQKDALM